MKANTQKKENKATKLEKVLGALIERGQLTNDDVQALVKCSGVIATRYLSELLKQGKIKKVGTTGAHVVYVAA